MLLKHVANKTVQVPGLVFTNEIHKTSVLFNWRSEMYLQASKGRKYHVKQNDLQSQEGRAGG